MKTNHALMTLAEVAEFLDVSLRTVRRWVAEGLLPHERVGPHKRNIRARERDVRAMREYRAR